MKVRWLVVWGFALVALLLASCTLRSPLEPAPSGDVFPSQTPVSSAYHEPVTPTDRSGSNRGDGSVPGDTTKPTAVAVTATPTMIPPTPTSTLTATSEPPTLTPSVTPIRQLALKPTATPFALQPQHGTPLWLPYFADPQVGCNWLGVAGQVFDLNGVPVEGFVVEAGGTLAEQPIFGLAITGSAELYGPGGYEIKLADQPVTSRSTVWVRVHDLDGNPMSAPTYFNTYDNCNQNLTLLNFSEVEPQPFFEVYLPLVMR